MSIDHWLSDDGMKALKKMGWPEWDDLRGCRERLQWQPLGYGWAVWRGKTNTHRYYHDRCVTDHIALCLLRDWARDCIEDQYDGLTYASGLGGLTLEACLVSPGTDEQGWRLIAQGNDIDELLIKGILATGE